jgi:riboflavin kinase
MATDNLDILMELSNRKGKITTSKLAERLGSSQQTISRKLRLLEKQGFIHRSSHHRGQFVTLNEKGTRLLRKKYLDLRDIVERSKEPGVSFGGNLVSGSGEGRYYVSQDEYFLQFHEKLGFRPFLGTLNIKMRSVNDLKAKNEIEKNKPVVVKGFRKEKRTFGDILCYPCVVNRRIRGAIVIPERTHHPSDVVEIIAPVDLRKELSVKDGDYVHVEMRV